jgi:hypothetical protein
LGVVGSSLSSPGRRERASRRAASLFGVALLHASCGGGGGASTGPVSWPTLTVGDRYFQTDGRMAPLFLRNVTAASPGAFSPLFADARAAGTTVVRLQLTQGFGYETLGITSDGKVLSGIAASWDTVITEAERQGLGVIPVFAIWGDWNDGTPSLGWTHFDANPLAAANGGPAASPAELFADGSETQRLWLAWLSALVTHWSARPNIVAWETFSELDLATGATEASATAFAAHARDAVRAADPLARPVFASTSDLPLLGAQPWQTFWSSAATDLISLHTYDADLDRAVVTRAAAVFPVANKPVFLGESGLDAAAPDGTTLTSAAAAPAALESAIWAELVSGAATARALYWEDGYAVYYPSTGSALVSARKDLERQPSQWLADKDFRGLGPVPASGGPTVLAAAVGSADRVLGWARNADLVAPAWDAAPLDGATVSVTLPSGAADGPWTVTLTSPDDGAVSETSGTSQWGALSFSVPGPFNRVAFAASRP